MRESSDGCQDNQHFFQAILSFFDTKPGKKELFIKYAAAAAAAAAAATAATASSRAGFKRVTKKNIIKMKSLL